MLAEKIYPCQLRADFQQYYNLNIDDIGKTYSYDHAAILVAQLPYGSRIVQEEAPDTAWSPESHFLSLIEFWTHCIMWGMTKEGQKGIKKPKPIPSPGEEARKKSRLDNANKEFVDLILGRSETSG